MTNIIDKQLLLNVRKSEKSSDFKVNKIKKQESNDLSLYKNKQKDSTKSFKPSSNYNLESNKKSSIKSKIISNHEDILERKAQNNLRSKVMKPAEGNYKGNIHTTEGNLRKTLVGFQSERIHVRTKQNAFNTLIKNK